MNVQRYACPCCGYLTLDEREHYDICAVCFWEDDPIQADKPALSGGANVVSLEQAKVNFRRFGACDQLYIGLVRKPLPEEVPSKE